MSATQIHNFTNATRFTDLRSLREFLRSDPLLGDIPAYHNFNSVTGSSVRVVLYSQDIPHCWSVVLSQDSSIPIAVLTNHHWGLRSDQRAVKGGWMFGSEILEDPSDETFQNAVTSICKRKIEAFERFLTELGLSEHQYFELDDRSIAKPTGEEDLAALRYWRSHPFTLQTLLGSEAEEETS